MELILILPPIIAFIVAFFTLPSWIRGAKNAGLEGKDINKHENPPVAEAGGVVVIAGAIIGILIYVALKTFYFKSPNNLIEIFAIICSIMMLAFIGVIDDILGWKIGLGKKVRLVLCIFAAIPLIVINVGSTNISIPFLDVVNLGLIYTLVLIPIGIVGASTTFNFLAGYNGLESSQGIILLAALSIVAFFTGQSWLALIGLCLVASLIAFYFFNRFPAKVFPGDVMTYPIGGMIAIMAIVGNMEKIAIFFFIPYILEVILKSRGRLNKQSFGKPNRDNSLEMPYDKIYGMEHFSIWFLKKIKKDRKVYEKDVVYFINLIQIAIIILGFIIFRNAIF